MMDLNDFNKIDLILCNIDNYDYCKIYETFNEYFKLTPIYNDALKINNFLRSINISSEKNLRKFINEFDFVSVLDDYSDEELYQIAIDSENGWKLLEKFKGEGSNLLFLINKTHPYYIEVNKLLDYRNKIIKSYNKESKTIKCGNSYNAIQRYFKILKNSNIVQLEQKYRFYNPKIKKYEVRAYYNKIDKYFINIDIDCESCSKENFINIINFIRLNLNLHIENAIQTDNEHISIVISCIRNPAVISATRKFIIRNYPLINDYCKSIGVNPDKNKFSVTDPENKLFFSTKNPFYNGVRYEIYELSSRSELQKLLSEKSFNEIKEEYSSIINYHPISNINSLKEKDIICSEKSQQSESVIKFDPSRICMNPRNDYYGIHFKVDIDKVTNQEIFNQYCYGSKSYAFMLTEMKGYKIPKGVRHFYICYRGLSLYNECRINDVEFNVNKIAGFLYGNLDNQDREFSIDIVEKELMNIEESHRHETKEFIKMKMEGASARIKNAEEIKSSSIDREELERIRAIRRQNGSALINAEFKRRNNEISIELLKLLRNEYSDEEIRDLIDKNLTPGLENLNEKRHFNKFIRRLFEENPDIFKYNVYAKKDIKDIKKFIDYNKKKLLNEMLELLNNEKEEEIEENNEETFDNLSYDEYIRILLQNEQDMIADLFKDSNNDKLINNFYDSG